MGAVIATLHHENTAGTGTPFAADLIDSGHPLTRPVVRDPERGSHETRAVGRDPWGNTVVIYGPC
jgi:hypothetical protein